MLLLFLLSQVGLLCEQLVVTIVLLLTQGVGSAASKPCSDAALDIKSSSLTLLVPHRGREVLFWVNDLVLCLVNVKPSLLHLATELAHHRRRLRLVLVSLDLSLVLVGMIVLSLVSLRERVMECNSRPVIAETSKVCLRSLLFFNRDCDEFDLNLNRKLAS